MVTQGREIVFVFCSFTAVLLVPADALMNPDENEMISIIKSVKN